MPGNYYVYKHTVPNGKVYIGVTKRDPETRWRGGFGYAENIHFLADIMDFGWRNIQHEILYTGLSEQDALQKESELIGKFSSSDPGYGYNVVPGAVRVQTRPRLTKGKADSPTKAKPVICVETGEVFPSVHEAAKSVGVDKASIRQRIRTGQRCRGYHWEFVTNEQEEHRAG